MFEYQAEVGRVIDGDTVEMDIDLGCHIWIRKESVRLWGINTPELRGDGRPAGLVAKEYVVDWLRRRDGLVRICTTLDKRGKYGRLLVTIKDRESGDCLNDELLETGNAVAY